MKLLKLSLALAASVFTSSASHAAQYCITAETALVSALTIATSSAEDDEIRFVKGLLNINVNLDAMPKILGSLALRGGYDAGCTSRSDSQAMTQIKSQNNRIRLFPRQQSNITIERLDFDGLESFMVFDNIAETPGAYGLVLVSRSAFRNSDVGLWVSVLRHDVAVENSLFINNNRNSSSSGLILDNYYNTSTGQSSAARVSNCTLRGNSFGLWIENGSVGPNSQIPSVVNVISYGNVIDLVLSRPAYVHHSMYRSLSTTDTGALSSGSGNNSSTDPLLDANHRPKSGSRAIDSGDNAAVAVPLTARDYYGNTRIIGATVDRGAVEKTAFGF